MLHKLWVADRGGARKWWSVLDSRYKDERFAESVDEYGVTPLHIALFTGANLALVEALLAAGASVDATTNDGSTPLHSLTFD